MAPAFVEAGIAFASLNYLLAPAGSIGAMIDQVRRALAWLYRHAAELGIDSGRIVVAGHSAGGHLVAMALATDWPALARSEARPVGNECVRTCRSRWSPIH